MSITIKVPIEKKNGELNSAVILGKNNVREITALGLNIHPEGNHIFIDGYGKRDHIILGGFHVYREEFEKLCRAFIAYCDANPQKLLEDKSD